WKETPALEEYLLDGAPSRKRYVTTSRSNSLVDSLKHVLLQEGGARLTDGQLLELYISQHEEAAFAALVRRHRSMVWGVCRRVLGNPQDIEDSFQATFLILVRKATTIVPREAVGNWLYGVAYNTALKAKTKAARRYTRERQVVAMPEPEV